MAYVDAVALAADWSLARELVKSVIKLLQLRQLLLQNPVVTNQLKQGPKRA